MKILIVSEDIPAPQVGGLGKHAVRLGNALLEQGHCVTLMGRSDVDYAQCAAEVGFNGPFIGGFHLKRAGWKQHVLGVFLPFNRTHVAKRIARSIVARAGEFDVVHYHGHLPMVGRYIPPNVNFIQTRHDQGSECLIHLRFRNGQPCTQTDARACAGCATAKPNFVQRAISAAAVRQYRSQTAEAFARHKTIFVSDFLRQRFDQVVPGDRCRTSFVIHNFIDLKTLPKRVEPNSTTATPRRIVVVGRIDEAKGVAAFLELLSHRPASGLQVEIVGDGGLRTRTEEAFASPSVRFLGWLSQQETLQRVLQAGAVVVPSIWDEPCATTILEGLALGKPVLALARGGTPELKQYERWDGQLALFGTLEQLVSALVDDPLPLREPERDFKADVGLVLPQLIAAYQEGKTREYKKASADRPQHTAIFTRTE
jgi:glycosyltransferase involved in cell wall biosynthesis